MTARCTHGRIALVTTIMAALGFALAPADAAPARVAQRRYATWLHVQAGPAYAAIAECRRQSSCVEFPVRRGERFVALELDDDTPTVAGASVWAGDEYLGDVCGATNRPLAIPAGATSLAISIQIGTCGENGVTSMPTRGTAIATFTRVRR